MSLEVCADHFFEDVCSDIPLEINFLHATHVKIEQDPNGKKHLYISDKKMKMTQIAQ